MLGLYMYFSGNALEQRKSYNYGIMWIKPENRNKVAERISLRNLVIIPPTVYSGKGVKYSTKTGFRVFPKSAFCNILSAGNQTEIADD